MKTTLTFLLLSGISITGFCVGKTTPVNVSKTKPANSTKLVAVSTKPTASVERHKKPHTDKECKMEKRCMHLSYYYYVCPKCGYDTDADGICPRDSNQLEFRRDLLFRMHY